MAGCKCGPNAATVRKEVFPSPSARTGACQRVYRGHLQGIRPRPAHPAADAAVHADHRDPTQPPRITRKSLPCIVRMWIYRAHVERDPRLRASRLLCLLSMAQDQREGSHAVSFPIGASFLRAAS